MSKKNYLLGIIIISAITSLNFTSLSIAQASTEAVVSSPYLFNFNTSGSLQEAANSSVSTSPYWWLNSGGYLNIDSGRGKTVQGELPSADPWRLAYVAANPGDTDNGFHPQNIFRLLSRSLWQNARQETYFVISKDNLSKSSNRNSSNGLLIMNRYLDGNNLYYAGVRVDGAAVIKKKLNGTYYTLAYNRGVYPGTYNRDTSPNLLPKNKWIGLRSEVVNLPDGKVNIKLFLDKGWSGLWQLIAEATDDGSKYGPVIGSAGVGGIRTDFMDVQFENYRFIKL